MGSISVTDDFSTFCSNLRMSSTIYTWYEANGRIIFTRNNGMNGVGFNLKECESNAKESTVGQAFFQMLIDDTMPGCLIEHTIEYVAPFDRCHREQDYETAWKFFEKKYGN